MSSHGTDAPAATSAAPDAAPGGQVVEADLLVIGWGKGGKTLVRAGLEDGVYTAEIDLAKARNKSLIRDPGIFEVHPFRDRLPETYRI